MGVLLAAPVASGEGTGSVGGGGTGTFVGCPAGAGEVGVCAVLGLALGLGLELWLLESLAVGFVESCAGGFEFWELCACAAATVAISASKARETSVLRYGIGHPAGTRSIEVIIRPMASRKGTEFLSYLDAPI